MQQLKEHIEQLKKHLAEIHSRLQPLLNKEAKEEIQSQLKAISKSTENLAKTSVNIPAELRELKFKLIKQLDQFKEAEELHKEMLDVLSVYVAVKPTRRNIKFVKKQEGKKDKVIAVAPQFELAKLIESGLLPDNTNLVKQYKGMLITVTLTTEGIIRKTQNGLTTLHNSPSSAAVALTHKIQNGWTWWSVEGDVKGRKLDYYRQQYLNKYYETGR